MGVDESDFQVLGTWFFLLPLYRNTLRIQHATQLLRDGAHLTTSIEGIATLSGFKSKSAFYLAFKAVHEMSPIEWIQKNV